MQKRIWTLLIAAAAAAAPAVAQDAFGYTATSAVIYAYQNVAGTGSAVLANADDSTQTIGLPFNFRFYGSAYSSVCVSSNGLLAFGSCVANDFTNLDLTMQSPPDNQPLIAPFWTDLSFAVPGAGAVYYQTLGVAPARQFVIQWSNAFGMNAPGALNFQVILAETANTILFQYQNVESGSTQVSKGKSATVGIRGQNGNTNGYRTQWSYNSAVLTNNLAIRFSPPVAAGPADVSANIKATTSALVYNRVQQTYNGTITITNGGTTPINRPLTIVLTSLAAGVTALNATGTVPGQGPFYNVPGTGALAPGQSAAIPVSFSNPSGVKMAFTVKTYSGSF